MLGEGQRLGFCITLVSDKLLDPVTKCCGRQYEAGSLASFLGPCASGGVCMAPGPAFVEKGELGANVPMDGPWQLRELSECHLS